MKTFHYSIVKQGRKARGCRQPISYSEILKTQHLNHTSYLSFLFHRQDFLIPIFYTKKTMQNTQKLQQIPPKSVKICSSLRSIWKILHQTEFIFTGLWCLWQIWGMSRDDFLSLGTRMAHELSPFPTLGNGNEMLGFLGMIKNRTFDTQWVCDTFNVLLYSAVFGPCNKIFWKNATKKFQITSFMCKTIDEMYHIN